MHTLKCYKYVYYSCSLVFLSHVVFAKTWQHFKQLGKGKKKNPSRLSFNNVSFEGEAILLHDFPLLKPLQDTVLEAVETDLPVPIVPYPLKNPSFL